MKKKKKKAVPHGLSLRLLLLLATLSVLQRVLRLVEVDASGSFGFFLDDMQAPWWAAMEVGRLFSAGLIIGFFLIVANFGALLVALLIALQVFDLSSASAEWAEMTTLVFGAIATLQTVLQLIVASASLLAFIKSHLRVAARSITRDPAATQDTSSSVPLSVLMVGLDTGDADELPATDLGGKRRGPAQEAADESEATSSHPAAAVPAVPAAAADEPDLEEAVELNADSVLWRASEHVAAARYVLRPETEIVDKSQSDLFMPLRSETAPPAPLTHWNHKKKRRDPVAARSTSPPDDDL